ncbi:ferrous iron transporter B, partial [Xanthomonas vasicola pv. musacearum NCPPB 4394]|uniref:type IV pilus assembly protein FimV n=1 Tax=Xanthomonas vasicola TaxID=56459 RepID=UPI0004D91928
MLLMACSGAAMALGLGDIRVLSKPGQPLVAEIPVISNEPGELDNARVALASATTFARVGLERPQGLVGNLQFQFAQDARGRAVIRVTSSQAVDQPAINFLIEVEWDQGRLVREYSALVDAPSTAAAIAEPAIQAPRAGASNAITREPAAAPVANR